MPRPQGLRPEHRDRYLKRFLEGRLAGAARRPLAHPRVTSAMSCPDPCFRRRPLLQALAVVLPSLLAWLVPTGGGACTTAVISGKVTADGRPLLWKNRDISSTRRNEVVVFDGLKHRVLAVANAGKRDELWMGVNSAGFCIENSVSRDLAGESPAAGPGNGGLIKLALETCSTVEDFRALLERTGQDGRKTRGNFGVIDALGGAALFEAGATDFQMYDANDPDVAPNGYVVRANFALSARKLPPVPDPAAVIGTYAGERYLRACRLLDHRDGADISVRYLLRHLCRDLADEQGNPHAGSVNGVVGDLPVVVDTASTISRTTTVSAAVFHGVTPGEDPLLTTMWVALGDPKFSIAVPCWVSVEELTEALSGPYGGVIGSIANTLREWNLTRDRTGVRTEQLPQIWSDLWPVENRMLATVDEARARWSSSPPSAAETTEFHRHLAAEALDAMRIELAEMKRAALTLPAPPPPVFSPSAAPALAP
jgi:hypothetical protein